MQSWDFLHIDVLHLIPLHIAIWVSDQFQIKKDLTQAKNDDQNHLKKTTIFIL